MRFARVTDVERRDGDVERTDKPSGALQLRDQRAQGIEVAHSHALDLDARRRLLEQRIESAKDRLVADIDRAKTILTSVRRRAASTLTRVALVAGGLMVLGLVTVLARRRARRIRVTWR